MQDEFSRRGEELKVLWTGLAWRYLLMLRSEELFDRGSGKVNDAHCLQRRDVAIFKGNEQLEGRNREKQKRCGIRFRGSKGDQDRNGAILVRVRGGRGTERDEGAVALRADLLDKYQGCGLSGEAPLMTYRRGGKWKVWNRDKATKYGVTRWSRERKGAGAKLEPTQSSLHSGKMGGVTRLATMGVPDGMIQREGRWKSELCRIYGRANMEHPTHWCRGSGSEVRRV